MLIILKNEKCFCTSQINNNLPKRLLNLKTMTCYNMCNNCYKNIEYDILSYTWDGIPTVHVDKLIIIPKWLSKKILILKKNCKQTTWIWIDAICINQQDINDKKEQIPLMAKYYKKAKVVKIILENFECDDKLFEDIRDSVEYLIEKSIKVRYFEGKIDIEYRDKINEKLDFIIYKINMEDKKWATRIWTLQEFVLGKKLHIVDENHLFDLTKLFCWIKTITDKWEGIFDYTLSSRPIFNSLFQSLLLYNENNNSLSVTEILQMISGRKCSVEEDNIYGILGFLENVNIPINYNIGRSLAMQNLLNYAISIGDTAWFSSFGRGIGDNKYNKWGLLTTNSNDVGFSVRKINKNNIVWNLEEVGKINKVLGVIRSKNKTKHKSLIQISKIIEKSYGYKKWEKYMLIFLTDNMIKDDEDILEMLNYLKKTLLYGEDIDQKDAKFKVAINMVHNFFNLINESNQKLTIAEIILEDKTTQIKCIKGRAKVNQKIYQDVIKINNNMMAIVGSCTKNNFISRTGIFMCNSISGINNNEYKIKFKI
jgi:hypothetical protein